MTWLTLLSAAAAVLGWAVWRFLQPPDLGTISSQWRAEQRGKEEANDR